MKKIQNIIYNLYSYDFKEKVLKRFKKICGFFKSYDIDNERKKEALLYFEKSFDCFNVNSIYSFFDINFDTKINNYILQKFSYYNVFGIFFFAISASEIKYFDKSNILREFYFDLTGTAIIDISRDILKNKFEKLCIYKFKKYFISEPFGAGFLEINYNNLYEIFNIINCSEIGIKLDKNGVIKPDKSFIGFFVVSEKPIVIENYCKSCIGSKSGCFLCNNKNNFIS